ncbi:MAG: protease complex subunit PrcB family protein [Actinobacteria bacterium]|nr:protease complex subunit PrcB family protein [Actinomycetota bacterium]
MTHNAFQLRMRTAFLMLIAVMALGLLAGCGDDDSGTETGKGAPPGVTGDEAGGFTVEAGKQRDPKDIAEEKENFSSEPPPIQILSGDQTGYRVDEPTAIIARSNKEAAAMRKQHFSHGVKKESIVPIDYTDRQLVGVFMPESKRGVLISITDIYEDDGKVIVKTTRLLPGDGCKTAKTKPRPFHMVETRKMQGQPEVKLEDIEASAC